MHPYLAYAGHKHEGVRLRHITGDAASAPILSPVIMKNTIHTAIVLGTQTTVRLGAHHRDTRILNILLLLRKLWSIKREGVPMHIVGENNEDMTARLALAPKRIGKIRTEPDFVNSQAVSARALVQTLAYPLIQPAISDLFQESKNSAEIVTVPAQEYVPLDTPLLYGVVRAMVLQTRGERSICIGILWRAGHSGAARAARRERDADEGRQAGAAPRILSSDIQNRVEAATTFARMWKDRAMRRAAKKWTIPNGDSSRSRESPSGDSSRSREWRPTSEKAQTRSVSFKDTSVRFTFNQGFNASVLRDTTVFAIRSSATASAGAAAAAWGPSTAASAASAFSLRVK